MIQNMLAGRNGEGGGACRGLIAIFLGVAFAAAFAILWWARTPYPGLKVEGEGRGAARDRGGDLPPVGA